MRAITFSLLVTAACGTLATSFYFVFRDDLFTRLIGHQTQTQINYEDQIADLRAQIDCVSRLDQERVEQQIKPLLQRQATLEEVTSRLAKELSLQARNSLSPSGTIGTRPLLLLDPETRLLDESDQPASKGYIMYANSPMHWTPVALPDEIGAVHAPRTNNIRAEIEQAATLFDVDIQMMKAFAKIESAYNPKARTGSYKCLFQLSNWEFAKYWQGDIYDIRDCSVAAARKFATEAAQFEKDVGRRATAAELYCIHQQGYEGCAFHYDAPQQLAWKNMYLTT